MSEEYINLTPDNLDREHVCCAIGDKKHQCGVTEKKLWLADRLKEGHVFRKLNQKGKIFIEYAPLEKAWVPVEGESYFYIYCLWVAGSFKGKGYGKELLDYCVEDARTQGRSGVCIISSKKKKPFLADKKFLLKHGFKVVDTIGEEYELMALSFDGACPRFRDNARLQSCGSEVLTIYYSVQCPFTENCIRQVSDYCESKGIPLITNRVDTLEKAKNVPGLFTNWAVFYEGRFLSNHLLNEGYLKKLLGL